MHKALPILLLGLAMLAAPATSAGAAAPEPGFKLPRPAISSEFPYEVRFADVLAQRVAYVSAGEGVPVVFVHGNPTSSYLWRNVLPLVENRARVVAFDLPGLGRSSKPREPLRFASQVTLFSAFLEQLGLEHVVLVAHDWGAAIAFEYARLHPDNVRAIAFMEGVLPPIFPQPSFEAMGEEMGGMFRSLKDPAQGRALVVDQNLFIERILPGFVDRNLSAAELDAYRRPFADPADREAMLMWPREIPIAGEPADVVRSMEAIRDFMRSTSLPVLLLYADPGVLVPPALVPWYAENFHDFESVYIGQALHFVQEDQPLAVGRALDDWLRRMGVASPQRTPSGALR